MCAHAARRLAHLPLARCVLDACAARLGYPDRAAYARMFAWSTVSEWFRLGYSLRELLGIQVRMPGDSSTPMHSITNICAWASRQVCRR